MPDSNEEPRSYPANAVFALMDEKEFRYEVIRPALEKDKEGLCRLVTGKHQLRGFRHISKAPMVMLVPVISDEANESSDLAEGILKHWFSSKRSLKKKVSEQLIELGYEPRKKPFDDSGMTSWKPLTPDQAQSQFDGNFIEEEDKNAVMLMSLLLGWFGSEEEEEDDDDE